ncbi:MAG: gliding motility protein GldM [Cyclobacteriaceae bacterium]|nr:gliding motility protein GldM [Cyclobacteriaceae bacterium]
MAGGKETGRQKMVGMMYLVLTALLALNVSMTVIDKFVFINESLVRANNETRDRNVQILTSVEKTVEETGNREADKKVVQAAQKIREETQRVITELDSIKKDMVFITGGYEDEHEADYVGDAKHLTGKTDYSKVGHYMMPEEEGGEGKGLILKELLNGYAENVKAIIEAFGPPESELLAYKPIAVDADEDPVYNKDPNQKGKIFSTLAFEESPTPACLATMSEFQSRILSYETRALDFLSKKVGAGDISFDKIEAKVLPESKYVAAGTAYKAEMFIAASASGSKPQMYYDDKEIPVENGIGLVEFVATPGAYVDGRVRKEYEAKIKVPIPGGGDTTYSSKIEYFVTEPVISIQSKSVSALFLNCGNALDVQVPALGQSYDPRFSAKGGSAIAGSTRGTVTLVPNARTFVLTVSSGSNLIGSREFAVRPIPAPDIKAFTDRGEVDQKAGISSKTPKLYLNAVPEAGFAEFLPDDAKFRVAQAEITLVSGGIARGTIQVNGNQANMAQIASSARKGDVIVVEIKKVQRQNFKGQVEDFPRFTRFISIPLN